jgi:hypothetical protein
MILGELILGKPRSAYAALVAGSGSESGSHGR